MIRSAPVLSSTRTMPSCTAWPSPTTVVAVFLVGRKNVKGGETRVFEASGPQGQRFTLTEPWSVMLLDDARMIHETTPIQPEQPGGVRDTLVLTYRRQGFQGSELTRRRKD